MRKRACLCEFLLILIACYLCSCTTGEISLEQFKSVRNASFNIMVSTEEVLPQSGTFFWGPQLFKLDYNREFDLTELNDRLRDAIDQELRRKGINYLDSEENADLLVGYAIAVGASIDENDLNQTYGDEFNFSFPATEGGQERSFEKGVVIIDIVNNQSKKLLWRGVVMADVKVDVSETEKKKRTKAAIKSLLSNYPKPDVRRK